MITFYNSFTYHLFCLSSDTKPLLSRKETNGTFLLEIDTGKRYCWDFANQKWIEQPASGGGSGTKYAAGTGIDITNNTISLDVNTAKIALDISEIYANVESSETTPLSTLQVDNVVYKIPEYEAGDGITITDHTISLDGSQIATIESVKKMLADDSDKTIAATTLSVLEDGDQVSVATVNKVVTNQLDGTTEKGNYVFTEI